MLTGDLKFNGVACENKKLKIFHADPFDYQSITDALKGCSGLFYAFEPPEDQLTYDVSCSLTPLQFSSGFPKFLVNHACFN